MNTPENASRESASVVDAASRWHWLRQYGDFSLAYATHSEPELSHFSLGNGYLAYRKHWRYTYVLGDPVAPRAHWPELIDAFLTRNPGSVFCQISEDAAECLQHHRYWINEFGIDTYIDLRAYDFRGKEKEKLRYATNWLASHGYRIEEHGITESIRQEMESLIRSWHALRVRQRDVGFLNRGVSLRDEPDVRKFVLWDERGTMQAFLFFDPLYRDGEIIGYVTAVKRRHPDSTSYAEMGLTKTAITRFQEEGKTVLRLGLSPLVGIENKRFRHVRPMHYSFRYGLNAWWVNRYFYNLKGHAAFKRRFGGVEEKTHYASPVYFNDLRLACMLRMMNVI